MYVWLQVTEGTKIGEGYNIASPEMCNQFCTLTMGCEFWTWYNMMLEEDTVKDNVCFALSRCDLVTQRCEQCTAGKKVIIIYPLSYIIILMCIMIGIYLIIRKPQSVSIAFLLIKHFYVSEGKDGCRFVC